MEDFHVVIRCANERTQSVSWKLARHQAQADGELSVISEVPFEAALRAAYEAGIRAGKEWTITLDADVLLNNGAIARLLEHAQQMPAHFMQLEGLVYDKIVGRYRSAGHRVYRTELLPRALRHIPEDGSEIRPELFTVKQMGRDGHPSRYVSCLVGLHDYEQSYCDLYRKGMVHSKKWSPILPDLIRRCAQHMHADPDFLVILKGLWDGLALQDSLAIDRRLFANSAPEALRLLGIEEKGSIEDEDCFVKDFPVMFEDITSRNPASDAITDKPMQSDPADPEERGWFNQVQERISKHGLLRGSAASFGALLRLVGKTLDR
jgi:hypothetical protein